MLLQSTIGVLFVFAHAGCMGKFGAVFELYNITAAFLLREALIHIM